MLRQLILASCAILAGVPASAGIGAFPAEIHMRDIKVDGAVTKDAGHWLMEEQPVQTAGAIRAFLDKP